MGDVTVVRVFAAGTNGGNPAPVVVDAAGWSDEAMRGLARQHGLESGFVLPAAPGGASDFAFRFWVPQHEMSMCGHATVGAVWLLDELGRLPRDEVSIHTGSGPVRARVRDGGDGDRCVEISQPPGRVEPLVDPGQDAAGILDVLGITADDLVADVPIVTATTSRPKTMVPLRDVETLHALSPDFPRVQEVCDQVRSTGLYPYVVVDGEDRVFEARQFPRSSGYPEDAATGIAASALTFAGLALGLLDTSARPVRVRQGRAMGRPSEITVALDVVAGQVAGCWLGGPVRADT